MKELNTASISLDLLRTLLVFSEAGTVEAAAQKLQMTQAGVSLQLKKLEDQVGGTLFRTLGRKKALTDLARDLCQSIAPPLRDLETRLAEVRRRSNDPRVRVLRFGGRAEILSRVLEIFDDPGQLVLRAMTSAEALSALREDQIDVALLAEPPVSGEFISRPLFDESVVIAVPWEWSATMPDLLEKPSAAYKVDPPYLREIAAHWNGSLNIKYVCEDWNAIGKLVSLGRAWAAMPESLVPAGVQQISVPVDVVAPIRFHAVYGRHLKGLADQLSGKF